MYSRSGKKGVYVVLFGDINTSFSRESSDLKPFSGMQSQFPERDA